MGFGKVLLYRATDAGPGVEKGVHAAHNPYLFHLIQVLHLPK
jgi:hypothetical protein